MRAFICFGAAHFLTQMAHIPTCRSKIEDYIIVIFFDTFSSKLGICDHLDFCHAIEWISPIELYVTRTNFIIIIFYEFCTIMAPKWLGVQCLIISHTFSCCQNLIATLK